MTQRATDVSIGVSDLRLRRGQHVCYVFSDDEERFRTLARYYRAGAEQGDKLSYLGDEVSTEELHRLFAQAGVEIDLERRSAAEVYHPDGRFVPEAMIDALACLCRRARADGFAAVRTSGEMSWALGPVPGSERLLEYEVLVDAFFEDDEHVSFTGICQYDARLFDGATIQALIEIHPFLLVGGQILRNPNHVSSGEMMRRLRMDSA